MTTIEAAAALCRFVHDTAALLLWGASAYLVALVPSGLRGDIGRRLEGFRIGAGLAAVLTTLAILPIDVAGIGEGWADALDPATLYAVLADTGVGHGWQGQAVAALLLAASLAVSGRARWPATTAAAGLAVAALALTGHAAMREGWPGLAQRGSVAGHGLAAGAWVGALVPLVPVLAALDEPGERRREAGRALRRFSTAGHAAVALVIVTGALNTQAILGRWPTDWRSPYQGWLSGKIALVLVMTGLAVFNRYVVVPRMMRSRPWAAAVRAAVLVEMGLGAASIACVGVFGLMDPV